MTARHHRTHRSWSPAGPEVELRHHQRRDGSGDDAPQNPESPRGGLGGFGPWAGWVDASGFGRPGGRGGSPATDEQDGRGGQHAGPPPWVAGLLGLGQGERRGPRARRGDVRSAILDVLAADSGAAEPLNGYQVIVAITERSGGAWKPSPGSVYPTVQQLLDEGLVEAEDDRGRRSLRLSETGRTWCTEHADELAAVWAPFAPPTGAGRGVGLSDLKGEIGQVMSAVWQIVSSGSDIQRRAAAQVLVETRRSLYGILADGPEAETSPGDGDGDGDGDGAESGEGDVR